MHDTAFALGKLFFETYVPAGHEVTIVDVGAADVNGSLRSAAPPRCRYVGVDMAEGKGVDVVASDPYALPLKPSCADIVVCSSCFEHSEHFWLLFNELQRILKPGGVCYINVPSNGAVHRYPVDCWRFYPDSGGALAAWAQRSGHETILLESFTARRVADNWNDYVAVFSKGQAAAAGHPWRMSARLDRVFNLTCRRADGTLSQAIDHGPTEDMLIQRHLAREVVRLRAELAKAKGLITELSSKLHGAGGQPR